MKLFATDLDGTLLNRTHQTDPTILEGMETIRQNGDLAIPTTGRSLPMLEELHFPAGPKICSNGAVICDADGTILQTFPIPPELVKELLAAFPDMPFELFTEDEILSPFPLEVCVAAFEERWHKRGKNKTKADYAKLFANHQENVPIAQILARNIVKINANRNDTETDKRLQAWLENHPELVNAPSDNCLYEITSAKATKGNAVRFLADHLKADEIFTFGDGLNDVSMLELTPHSYAPDNGNPAAKNAAAHILPSADEHFTIHKMLELSNGR